MVIEAILLAAALAGPAPQSSPMPNAAPQASPVPSPAATAAPPLPVPVPASGVPQNVTLQQAIDIAAARSPVLAAARADYELTVIPVQLAKTAVYPLIDGAVTTQRSNNGGVSTASGGSVVAGRGSFTSNGVNATLKQLIYDGGKVIAQIHQARANEVGGAQTYQRQLETLSFNVAQAYYSYLQARATVLVDQQLVTLNKANEALVQAQVRTGVAPRVDLVTAHVPTVQAQVALIQAQGAEASSLGAFANQLGLDANTLVRPINNTPANPAQTLVTVLPYEQALTRALALRPDYHAAQSSVLAAEYNVQVQRTGTYPNITANASYGTNSTTVDGTDFRPGSATGFTLSLPLYDQGVTRAQVATAQAQLDLANYQLAQTRLGVQLNVQQAVVGVISDQAAVTQNQAALASAQESLRATQAQYKAGVTNLFSLLQAQTNLTSAETTELTSIYTLRQAEQSYIFALGESSINPISQ